MSIDDATPEQWDEVNKKLREDKTYGDDVDSPFHYNKGSIECIDAIEAASSREEFEGYLRSNVLKYVWRFRYKDNIKSKMRKKLF